jgi:hypothetical protein
MDRIELRAKFASRVEAFPLEEFDLNLFIKPLSALDRARIVDGYKKLKADDGSDAPMEVMTVQSQCYIVSRGLVDEKGNPCYGPDELEKIAEEIPGKALDKISNKILSVSGMLNDEQPEKNLIPAPNENFSSVLQ